MNRVGPTREAAALLAGGIVLFGAAAVAADPYEQKTREGLYRAIAADVPRFAALNGLATIGVAAVVAGFLRLARGVSNANAAATTVGTRALVLGALLWMAEVGLRLTTTLDRARALEHGGERPTHFPHSAGVGQDPLFSASLAALLAGIASVVWAVGDAGLVRAPLARLGASVVVGGGALAAATYPFIGAVERVLFYPFISVVAPLAVWLLVRDWRLQAQRAGLRSMRTRAAPLTAWRRAASVGFGLRGSSSVRPMRRAFWMPPASAIRWRR